MEKIRTAVVGAGKMGTIHAKVYSKLDGCSLIAVVDTQEKSGRKLAKKYGCQYFCD